MDPDISIIGTGYVGLVTGACFAAERHRVICADIDVDKIAELKRGHIPIYEPHLDELIRKGIGECRLAFTSRVDEAIGGSSLIFIAVGTPSNQDGSTDLRAMTRVADTIARTIHSPKTVVVKSTVPVGTAQAIRAEIASKTHVPVAVLSNPEYLREGHAVRDFMRPDRVVIGADDEEEARPLREIYEAFVPNERILLLDTRSAELSKYASNAFLATKISFINEIAGLAEALGADIELVRRVLGLDPRIGPGHLAPGLGYGGSCFPKDMQSLLHTGRASGTPTNVLDAVEQVNAQRPVRLFQKILDHFRGRLADRRIALWGLAFKPGTDDMRDAPSLRLVDSLLRAGAHVVAYDPVAASRARSVLDGRIEYAQDQYDCVACADALVLVTEWEQFKFPEWERLRTSMSGRIIFDGRNLYSPDLVTSEGFAYAGIGRARRDQLPPRATPADVSA